MKNADYLISISIKQLDEQGATVDKDTSKHICSTLADALKEIELAAAGFDTDPDGYIVDKIILEKVPHEELPF